MRRKAQAGSFGRVDLRRCAAGSSFLGDDLLQVFDAVTRKGGHAVFADAIDPKAAILGTHVTGKVEQPIFVLAEQVGDVADRKTALMAAKLRPPDAELSLVAASSTAAARRSFGRDGRRFGSGRQPARLADRRHSFS